MAKMNVKLKLHITKRLNEFSIRELRSGGD